MNEWIIEHWIPEHQTWGNVNESIDLGARYDPDVFEHVSDMYKRFAPKSLERCIEILTRWQDNILNGSIQMKDTGYEWQYRIRNVNTDESIHGDLFI